MKLTDIIIFSLAALIVCIQIKKVNFAKKLLTVLLLIIYGLFLLALGGPLLFIFLFPLTIGPVRKVFPGYFC